MLRRSRGHSERVVLRLCAFLLGSVLTASSAAAPGDTCPEGRRPLWRLDLGDPRWNRGEKGVLALVEDKGGRVISGAGNARVVADRQRGPVLEIRYPAQSGSLACVKGGRCPLEGGLNFRLPLPDKKVLTSVVLSYWVKFEPGFAWVKGGKLPGLCGGACPTGGRSVGPDRFSVRYMWRRGGEATVYAYITHPPNREYGRDLGAGAWRWQADGRWHRVEEELVLNTGNDNDGVIRVWYDRKPGAPPTFERKDVRFYDRTRHPDAGIDTFIFSTFHGGNDGSWSPPKEVTASFADFQVCR